MYKIIFFKNKFCKTFVLIPKFKLKVSLEERKKEKK